MQKDNNTINDFTGVLYYIVKHYIKQQNKQALNDIYTFTNLIPLKLLIENNETSEDIFTLQKIISNEILRLETLEETNEE